jgi:adenine-specific DNA-methyltransferase
MPSTGWRWEEDTAKAALAEDPLRIHFGKDHTTIPNRKSYLSEIDEEPMLSVFYTDGRAATLEVESILGPGAFQFPKDSDVIADLIGMVTKPGDIVLDSFSGSGTTAHAILKRNKHLNANLRFILVELDEKVAKEKTRLRVQRAIDGFTPLSGKKRNPVDGLGGSFRYCELGETLFDENGTIRDSVKFGDLGRYVYFLEASEPIPKDKVGKSPLLGVTPADVAVYLLFNGILKDKSVDGGNILTSATYDLLPKHAGPKVVYAAGCRFGAERLKRENIIFKQTPYTIRLQ